MKINDLYTDAERDTLRKRVVEFLAPHTAPEEIARRLGTTVADIHHKFRPQLKSKKWSTAEAVQRLNHRARGGDADAALLWLAATDFDRPAMRDLLFLPPPSGTQRH